MQALRETRPIPVAIAPHFALARADEEVAIRHESQAAHAEGDIRRNLDRLDGITGGQTNGRRRGGGAGDEQRGHEGKEERFHRVEVLVHGSTAGVLGFGASLGGRRMVTLNFFASPAGTSSRPDCHVPAEEDSFNPCGET